MRHFRLDHALLPTGWAADLFVSLDANGIIRTISHDAENRPAQRVRGLVLPGMPNAHSHAAQRALAGRAEARTGDADSFWTWRDAMYRLSAAIDPDSLYDVALYLFIEMLHSGYTSVAEFHYLHNAPDGSRYEDRALLGRTLLRAAKDAGLGITLLPTLYQNSDFGGAPARQDQRRFTLSEDEHVEIASSLAAAADARSQRIGAAFHSLRAVTPECIARMMPRLDAIDASLPFHIHLAEQPAEVEACLAVTGQRPIELVANQGFLSERWSLVHATHATPAELASIAAAGAIVCLCPTTEANLGDGLFDLPVFEAAGGLWSIGSDSQITVSPSEELRLLDYCQRLRAQKRSVSATAETANPGLRLWRDAALAGARSLAQPVGKIAAGCRADWVVLDPDHPALHAAGGNMAVDALVFIGHANLVRDVMVAGQWVVRDGRHSLADAAKENFKCALARLAVSATPG